MRRGGARVKTAMARAPIARTPCRGRRPLVKTVRGGERVRFGMGFSDGGDGVDRAGATDEVGARIDRLVALIDRLETTLAERDAALRAALAQRDAEAARRAEAVRALDAAIDDLKLMAQE
jgi:hypothetical protein